MGWTSNIPAVSKKMDGVGSRIGAKLAPAIKRLLVSIDVEIHARTPVWSGKAVRNMIWTVGTPNGVEYEPIDNGPPGDTNRMPLGPEPRRAPNTAAARATLEAITVQRPFKTYYLTNVADHIGELERGALPSPETSRAAGMFRLTYAGVLSRLRTGGLL